MQEFIFKSKLFEGYMKFGYIDGVIVSFENQAQLTTEQIGYFERNFPFRSINLAVIKGKHGKIEEITDLSFDNFWNIYDNKVDKINAQNYWEKMSKADKLAALSGINRYKTSCRQKNTPMVYAVRYLRNRRYEDGK
jgi:hypothetical protein